MSKPPRQAATIQSGFADIHVTDRAKETNGWRTGRPIEDPAKTKRWGFVAAKPSEYLVHVRKGKVRTRSSGQGAVCFKLPWDSVAVIPTSLQQLRFRADQVTLEKVGIEVTGLAVYRIADPLIAYRVLNFSFPERAQEKLEETLTSMFVGAARRLIANLTLDDCLQKRKMALAEELLREVAPVVGAEGRLDDTTDQGWGIVIDTIEVQEVRVLSDAVFSQMQAPFRAALDRRAREARAEAEKEVTAREAACNQAIEEARLSASLVVAEKKKEVVLREADIRREQELQGARISRELEEQKLLEAAELKKKRVQVELAEREEEAKKKMRLEELKQKEAESEIATHAVLMDATAKRMELERAQLLLSVEKKRADIDMFRAEGEAKADIAQRAALARVTSMEADARLELAKRLPELANAMGQKIGEMNITTIGDNANPFATVAHAMKSVVDMVKAS
jgi:flotillin